MQTPAPLGTVVSLWRYPVKSMMGEELTAAELTEHGLRGDRAYALVDTTDGKVATAKNPRKWPRLFEFRAAFTGADKAEARPAPVSITLPDGTTVTSEQVDCNKILSRALAREVMLESVSEKVTSGAPAPAASAEEYWPDMEGLDFRDTVTDFRPAGGHVLRLRGGSSADDGDARPPRRAVSSRAFRSPSISTEHRRTRGLGGEGFHRRSVGRAHSRHRRPGLSEHHRSVCSLRDDDLAARGPSPRPRHPAYGGAAQPRSRRRVCGCGAGRHDTPR